jgi:hypothetical protein
MNCETRRQMAKIRPEEGDTLQLLRHNLRQVELARAAGEPLRIEWALPTCFDAFLSFLDKWGVVDAIEKLPDRRVNPKVALAPLVMCILCRFLIGLKSFQEVEEVLFRHRELLLRLGFTLKLVEQGAYPSTGHKPCDAECLSEAARMLDWEAIRGILVEAIKQLRQAYPKHFRNGQFLVDSNEFEPAGRHKGTEQEIIEYDGQYKVCSLMLRTPHEMIPVDFRIAKAGAGGEGETTIGQALIEGAIQTYGEGFIKELVWDRGYLDGQWLRQADERHGFRWVMGVRQDMAIYEDAIALSKMEQSQWVVGKPPQFDDVRKRPKRYLCRVEGLETWEGYGKPLVGLVIKDVYPDKESWQVVVTPEESWSAGQIHERHRWRWGIEECYRDLTSYWQLGEKMLSRRADIYQVLVALMMLLYSMLQLYERTGAKRQTLLKYQRAFLLGPTHVLVYCGGWFAMVRLHEVNPLINMNRSP